MITFAIGFLPSRGLSLAHISRKELKKDEVRETFAHGAEAVMLHQQLTMWLVIAALAIGRGLLRLEDLFRAANGAGLGGV